MKKMLTESLENYLRAIYILHVDGKIPRIKDISKMLDVRDASAVEAIKKLESINLVSHEKYGYIDLTDKGISIAENVYRKYITLIDFFVNLLGLNKEDAYTLACGIEHHMDHDFYVSLEALNLFIKRNPIEYKKLQGFIKKYNEAMPHLFRMTLDELDTGDEAVIVNISGEELREKMFKTGVITGSNLIINNKNENSIEININNKSIQLSNEDAAFIIVE